MKPNQTYTWNIFIRTRNSANNDIDLSEGITHQLKRHLQIRGFKLHLYGLQKPLRSPDRLEFDFEMELLDNRGNYVVKIYWRKAPYQEPPVKPIIFFLVQDFFRLEHYNWLLLGHLLPEEVLKVEAMGRPFSTITILDALLDWDIEDPPRKPDVIEIGTYNNAQLDLYRGNKTDYPTALDFWIACASWVSMGEMELIDFTGVERMPFFDPSLGTCIPLSEEDLSVQLGVPGSRMKELEVSEIIGAWRVRRDYYDTMILLEYPDYFILYNWWTGE